MNRNEYIIYVLHTVTAIRYCIDMSHSVILPIR